MSLKQYKPNTPSQRGLVLVDRAELWKGKPVKALTEGLNKSGGRNNKGRITSRRRGGGHKRLYRVIDFKRRKFDVAALVQRIEYDPNRSAFIALLKYEDGDLSLYLGAAAIEGRGYCDRGNRADIKPGMRCSMEICRSELLSTMLRWSSVKGLNSAPQAPTCSLSARIQAMRSFG